LENPVEEAMRVLEAAEEAGIALRLFGGVAVYLRCPSTKSVSLQRDYVDVDFMAHAKQAREIKRLFVRLGYVPRERFNVLQGYRRLIFNDTDHQRRVDVFLDVFEMCHKFNFKERLEIDRYTISLVDLLATKLQIVEINEKDIKDMTCILLDHEVGADDSPEMINGERLAKLCSNDWGVYRTFNLNLDRLEAALNQMALEDAEKQTATNRMNRLRTLMEEGPKSIRWKMRAKVGDRIRWYELPEADREVVGSQPIAEDRSTSASGS
jgi:hypothetical protein